MSIRAGYHLGFLFSSFSPFVSSLIVFLLCSILYLSLSFTSLFISFFFFLSFNFSFSLILFALLLFYPGIVLSFRYCSVSSLLSLLSLSFISFLMMVVEVSHRSEDVTDIQ